MTDVLAATGARTGEVLALRWADAYLGDEGEKATVTISGTRRPTLLKPTVSLTRRTCSNSYNGHQWGRRQ